MRAKTILWYEFKGGLSTLSSLFLHLFWQLQLINLTLRILFEMIKVNGLKGPVQGDLMLIMYTSVLHATFYI